MDKCKISLLSGNALKVIAAVTMLVDHIGMILFPKIRLMRIIGRLAFPIFSYLIYEGCRYTGNKSAYLVRMALLGVGMTAVQYIATGELYFNVLVTFSCSVSLIFALKAAETVKSRARALSAVSLGAVLAVTFYVFTLYFDVDYGFLGITLAFLPALADALFKNAKLPHPVSPRFLAFSAGLVLLSFTFGGVQPYCLFSLVLLALYNGKRGFKLPKYAFYVFYPAHIALLWMIEAFI